jgi:aminoglycoside phosphotransferase (APT) family kinase protein
MGQTMDIADVADDEAVLRDCMAAAARAGGGSASPLVTFRRQRLASSTSYETGVIEAEFEDGRTLKAFLKDYGSSARPKDSQAQRREREIRFYRDVAPNGELGVPRYYGFIGERGEGPTCGDLSERHWLLLEFVDGRPVRYCDFEQWVAAAGWLGMMHGYFSRRLDRLDPCDWLERHSRELFESRAEAARRAVALVSGPLAERLGSALRQYDTAVRVMADQPRTLLHGGYHALNVLVNIQGAPGRICVIDWEEAGLGAPLADLSYFTDGFEPPRLDRLLDAYGASAAAFGLALPPRAETVRVMRCFRLHKLIQSLPKYARWTNPQQTLAKLVALAERYAAEVLA